MTEQERAAIAFPGFDQTSDIDVVALEATRRVMRTIDDAKDDARWPEVRVRAEIQCIIEAALRLLAATPAASSEVRERVAQSISSEGIHGAFRRHSNSTEAIRAWEAMSRIPADDWSGIMAAIAADVADAALSAIRPGDRLPAGVVVPEEPTTRMSIAGADSHTLISFGMAQDCYRAMIAAIAAAKEPGR